MASGFSIGYVNFTIFLLVLTGVVMLRLDVKTYEMDKLLRECKVARVLGWLNIVGGGLALVGNWVYQKILW